MASSHISNVRSANPGWFSKENKRFFGDIKYTVLWSRSRKPYLLRATHQWSDMFGQPKIISYRINEINPETLKIGNLLDNFSFRNREDAKAFIKSL